MLIDSLTLLEGSQVQNLSVESGDTFPSLPNIGELFFYDVLTSDKGLWVYDGEDWVFLGADITTHIAGGGAGSLPYQTAFSTTALLPVGTDGQVLTVASGIPSWAAPSGGGGGGTLNLAADADTNQPHFYPALVENQTSGTLTDLKVSFTKLFYTPASGNLNATSFTSLSDRKFKINIEPLNDSLSVVKSLNGVSFDWKDGSGSSYGFIAQDVEKIIPHAVTKSNDNYGVNYSTIVPFLVEAIKDQEKRISQLEELIKNASK